MDEDDEDRLKPLTVLSEDGRVLYDSKRARFIRADGDRMREWLVRSRLDALREGEGLSQRDLARKVDEALGLAPLNNGNPRSYRSINEYFSGRPMRGGTAAVHLAAMESVLLGEVSEYFGDTASAEESLRGDIGHAEVVGEFLHQVDVIMAGYMMAGSKDGQLANYYGGPLTDDIEPIASVGFAMVERTARSLVGIYVHTASSSAWNQGLRDQFLLHQACFGLFRAAVRRVAVLPRLGERSHAELAAVQILDWMQALGRAFDAPGRTVDPIHGPRPGIRLDPFLAYPTWRRFSYATRVKQSTYTDILYSALDKPNAREKEDLASAHTIHAVRQASDTVTQQIYRRIAEYAFENDDWRRIALTPEARETVATEYLESHLPGLKTLRCDGQAIRRMFGEGCEAGIGQAQKEHRRKFIEADPAGFRRTERTVQKAWEDAIDLAEAKLRRLGVSSDRGVMALVTSAIAVEIYGFLEDNRFGLVTIDGKVYDAATNLQERAFHLLRFFVDFMDWEIAAGEGDPSP